MIRDPQPRFVFHLAAPHLVGAVAREVVERYGEGMPIGTVFVARQPTGEIHTTALAAQYPERDWILTRILWLSGTEPGRNRLGEVDSMRRYIYIHGTPDTEPMGVPLSIGCVRMRNRCASSSLFCRSSCAAK